MTAANKYFSRLDSLLSFTTRKTAYNTGFASGGLTCKLGALCFQLNFSNKLKLCVPKPARTQSPKTLAVSLKDHATNQENGINEI